MSQDKPDAEIDAEIEDRIERFAKAGYEEYGRSSGGKNFKGDPMPEWEQLPEAIRGHWRRTAAHLIKLTVGELLEALRMEPT